MIFWEVNLGTPRMLINRSRHAVLLIFSCSPIVRICAREDSCFSLQTLEWQQQAQLPQPINNARIYVINWLGDILSQQQNVPLHYAPPRRHNVPTYASSPATFCPTFSI